LKRDEEALIEFDKVANLDPKNPYRYSSRAYFKDRIGDLKGAIEDYEKAIELDPEDAVSFNNKGLVEEKLGYKERSKKSFDKADNLVGYKPNTLETTPEPQKEIEEDSAENTEPEKKLTTSYYLKTLGSLFSSSKTRKEFMEFIKGFFLKKN
jgi:tetratricopeptide (TPR) repeat protein